LFELYGLGKMNIISLDNKAKKASIEIKDSTIAYAQLKKGKTKKSVCTITAGILAGIFSYVFEKDVDCIEKKCKAKGDDSCLFVI
jgi:predicted hydrocarbon binding protein